MMPAWLRNTSESDSNASQIRPLKYLRERPSDWVSLSQPIALWRLYCHHSSKLVTLCSLLRGEICQLSLTVPLNQLRSSGSWVSRRPSGSGSRAVFWVRNSTLAEYQSLSLMIGPETVGLRM